MLNLEEKIEKIKSGFKGVGNLLSLKPSNLSDVSWNILQGDVSLPAATLSKRILNHNQLWMKKFSEKFDFHLAPHGKTTMLPELFNQQISHGCWGMTLATPYQVAVAFTHGIKRTILANQLVGKCNMDIISTIFQLDPTFEFICLVDSPENVRQLGKFFSERKQQIKVLLEYGPMGGRTGIRNETQESSVLSELENWTTSLALIGIEFFEGILKDEQEIRDFIQWALSRVRRVHAHSVFSTKEVIISGAGTSWFDVVAEEFQNFENDCSVPLKKILRSGCYLIYDIGLYEKVEKRVREKNLGVDENFSILSESLKPALKIWAYVQSIPEPNLAIAGLGKRDIAVDCGFPVPCMHYRPGLDGKAKSCGTNENKSWVVFNMMDQHTFLKIDNSSDIQIGDIISFDIYHPCTTMDKWKNVLLIDDEFNVLDVLNSEF